MNAFLKTGIAAAFSTFVLASPASAVLTAPETETATFANLSSGSTTLTFDGFNTGLGTLVEVLFSFSANVTINNTAAVINNNPLPQAVGSPTPLTATATITATSNFSILSNTLTTLGFIGVVNPGPLNTVGTENDTIADSEILTNPFQLSLFTGGPSTVGVTVSASGNQGGSVPADVLTGNTGDALVSVTIQYRYNEPQISTPEPASMVLVGAGLLGLGLARRRRA